MIPKKKNYNDKPPVILYRELSESGMDKEIEAMKRYFPVTTNRTSESCTHSLVIARYSALPFYRELEQDLLLVGSRLVNSYTQHRYIADMSNWYQDLKELTPKTWTRIADVPDKGPFVLKGETNSRKHLWNTHMFAKDKEEVLQVACRLMDDSLIGHQGIYTRQYIPLKKFFDGLCGMPITEEYRFFCYNSMVLSGGYYWSSHVEDFEGEVPSPDNVPLGFLAKVMRLVGQSSLFYVVDVARTEEGEWIVVELNDGQMSGLSENDPDVLYKNLATAVGLDIPSPVYPGPPFMILLHAIREFDSPEKAVLPHAVDGVSELSGNISIPGAGDACLWTTRLIKEVLEGKLFVEELPRAAERWWTRMVGPGTGNHEKSYLPGLEQSREAEETIWPLLATKWGWRVS